MDASTKKMVKTFGIIIGAIIVLFVVIFIILAIANAKVNNGQLLNMLENSAKKYYNAHQSELPKQDSSVVITADTLIANKYMKPFEKLTKNTNCSGRVVVSNNGGDYVYEPSVVCNEYKSVNIATKLAENVVSEDAGLYKNEDTYYYRGEYVNNYIKLGNKVYRILSFGNDKMKIIDPKTTDKVYQWDNRYSHDVGKTLGINDYSKSRIRELYQTKYEEYDVGAKKYIVKSEWCIGKRAISNFEVNNVECDAKIEDYLGMITPYEYARASLDINCLNIRGGSCNNYNYISRLFDATIWTAASASDNGYQAYAFSSGFTVTDCIEKNKLAFLFNISSDNVYVSGDGSQTSPYIIR